MSAQSRQMLGTSVIADVSLARCFQNRLGSNFTQPLGHDGVVAALLLALDPPPLLGGFLLLDSGLGVGVVEVVVDSGEEGLMCLAARAVEGVVGGVPAVVADYIESHGLYQR